MMTKAWKRVAVAGILATVTGCTEYRETHSAGPIEFAREFVTEPVTDDSPIAFYALITNRSDEDDALTGLSAAFAERGEWHEQETERGSTRMRPLGRIPIPAGATVTLAPGTRHGMLIGLLDPPVRGDSVMVTLQFERLGTVEHRVPVVGYDEIETYLEGIR